MLEKRRRFSLSIGMLVMLVLLMLWTLAPMTGSAAENKIIHYVYSGHGAAWVTYLETMAQKFKEQSGITVEFVVSTHSSTYTSQLLTMIAGGVPPDVTDIHPMMGAPLVYMGIFEDLNPYVAASNFPLSEMPPNAVDGFRTPDGMLWGVLWDIYPVITFFNADAFADAGIANPVELGEGWTWEAARQAARRLTVDANNDGTPEKYGLENPVARWEMQVHQAGGKLYDRIIYPTESRFNTPEVRIALEHLQGFYIDKTVVPSGYWWGNPGAGFSFIYGPGIIGSYLQNVSFNYDVALQPKGPVNRAPRVNPDGLQMIRESKNKELAWKWLMFLTGSVENQEALISITGRFPSLRRAMSSYPRLGPTKLAPNWRVIIEVSFDPDSYPAYVVPYANEIDPVVNPIIASIWRLQISPQMALEQIHEQVSAILAEKLR
ncbi:MAG TPA: extracellular solute-binding protein [Firmicutes bacterium]|nr:extracellular solute-binding protein [Bacillota bacterium]